MERCPICRARLKGAVLCPRCGSDLSLPLAAVQQARHLERQAMLQLAGGNQKQAKQALKHALALNATPLARSLLGFLIRGQPLADADAASQAPGQSGRIKKFSDGSSNCAGANKPWSDFKVPT